MIALSLLLVAAALMATSEARRSSSSSSSTDNNESRKQFAADNLKNFEARLNTAVAKALLEQDTIQGLARTGTGVKTLDAFVRPFLKTYGVKSDRDFETTAELLDALKDSKRKRSQDGLRVLSSSVSSDSDADAVEKLLNSFGSRADKDAFRLAVLKQALVQHLRHGRNTAETKEVSDLLAGYDQWKAANAALLANPKAAEALLGKVPNFASNKKQKVAKQVQELFTTSSDK